MNLPSVRFPRIVHLINGVTRKFQPHPPIPLPPPPDSVGFNTLAPTSVTASAEKLMHEISLRLDGVEHLYHDIASRLMHVDGRIISNERVVRELQHRPPSPSSGNTQIISSRVPAKQISANSAPASRGGNGPTITVASSRRQGAQSSATSAPVSAADESNADTGASVREDPAGQIPKLIAGLDFLEQHIIRQDQEIASLKQQLVSGI